MQNKIIYPGSIKELYGILMDLKIKKIFLVSGKKSFVLCGAKQNFEKYLKDYEITHFTDFQINPDLNDVLKGITLFRKSKADIIISVGGGSVIDMAKLINYFHNFDGISEDNLINNNLLPIKHLAIPTTAGSGSEATSFAVMYIGDKKFSIENFKLRPNFVIIDPELHISQSSYQKVVSGVDAISQAIEAIWSINSTSESRIYAINALEVLWNNLPLIVNSNDLTAHLKVASASHQAGMAIKIAKTTAPHALSYAYTKILGLPHGHSVALTLPYFLKFNFNITKKNCLDGRGVIHVKENINEVYKIIGATSPENAQELMIDYFEKLGLKLKFNFDPQKIISNINLQRLANNPRRISTQELIYLISLVRNEN